MSAAVLRVSHFDLDKIAASGQCFRWEKLYTRKYRIPAGDACAYVTQTGDTLTVDDQNVLTSSVEFWANYFAVYDDYAGMWREINRYAAEDGPEAYLTRAARASDGVVILNQPIWETIVSFMVSQNNNIPRIRRSIQAICAECGTLHTSTYDYWYGFPTPDALACADLSNAGLGYREPYIKDLAAAVAAGQFDLNFLQTADYETARAYLKSVRGIGDKVANCIVRSFMREKKIYCGSNYREVDIFSYTNGQKTAAGRGKRSKKVKESEPKQRNLNDKNARRYFIQLGNLNFGDDPDALHVTATYSAKYVTKAPLSSTTAERRTEPNRLRTM